MNVHAVLLEAARRFPHRPALRTGECVLSWGEVRSRVHALARFLAARGVRAGDRVALLEWNSIAFFELTFAVAELGAVLMPVNVRLDGRQLAAILADGGARLLVADPDLEPLVRAALDAGARPTGIVWTASDAPRIERTPCSPWPELGPDSGGDLDPSPGPAVKAEDLCQLYFTSGTTGRPKGVMLTHANIETHARTAIAELAIDEHDVWAHVAPMFHLADAWATVAITLAGGCHVFVPRFDPAATANAIRQHGVTLTNLIPTMLGALTQHVRASAAGTLRDSSLRLLLSGGAPIAPELVRRVIEAFGCEYVQTYGMTESSPYLTLSLLDEALRREPEEVQLRYRAKTGRAFRGVDLRLVDELGRDVPADGASVGEILARGATVTPGYWNDPLATSEAFRDGWLCTGDLATLDERGFFDIVDRKKDMIVTGGENVYSTEVEHVLYEHPAVLEAAVVGKPDERWGERVHAVVALVPNAAATSDELIAHCRARLPGFKTPKSVEFLPSLPKTGSGKIQKRALR